GPDTKIVINSSAGTSEFSAAAIIASMMCPNVEAFTVGTSEYTIPNEEIERLYYRDGRPVGLTSSVHGARTIPKFFIDRPEENQVRALRSYYGRQVSGKTLSASAVIQQLKDDELWLYEMSASSSKTVPKQKETMYYQRHYVDNWVRNGWIEKPQGIGKYRLTDNGLVIINTFYVGDR
ncbi:MAG: DUF6293 family protein, partial [archaeon]|nr:DUF6293 family protein [archaeon]